MMDYKDFLAGKLQTVKASGFAVDPDELNPKLFKFQHDTVIWATKLGKAALFLECGMGKTFIQLEWARLVVKHTGGKVLILAPLAVAGQTVLEGEKFGEPVKHVQTPEEIGDANIVITNYERLHLFDAAQFKGVVLDESSILKAFMGKTKRAILETFKDTPYKLACTATPAPNDHLELGNHAAFLDVMEANEMISRWFVNDTMEAGNYRLKKHAAKDFWRWLTSWAVCLSKPGDLGAQYDMPSFDLPKLNMIEHRLSAAQESIDRAWAEGRLMPDDSPSSTGMHKVKRESLSLRVANSVQIVYNKWATDLISNSGELAWFGNQNTTKPESVSITTIPNSEKKSNHNSELQKPILNICETTTQTIKNASKNTRKIPLTKNEKMQRDVSAMQTTLNSESNVNLLQENAIKQQSSMDTYDTNSVSTLTSLSEYSNLKMDVVQYVAQYLQTKQIDDFMLTTIMKQAQSEGYSVQAVTWVLEGLKTASNCLESLLNISLSTLEQFVIWCDTDYEQKALEAAFGDYAISIYGSLSNDEKVTRIFDWLNFKAPILISKPSILGYGMNFQQCSNQILVGVSYSFEKFYQAIRRSYRFGQMNPVNIHLIYAETEGNIMTILKHKQEEFKLMQAEMNAAMSAHGLFRDTKHATLQDVKQQAATGDNWTVYLGDCVTVSAQLPTNSVDFGIHSPPFSNLYIYSDAEADMGNSADDNEFFTHYQFLIKEMLRITKPGRLCAVHCKDLPAYMNRDGAAGLRDFPGDIVRAFESAKLDNDTDTRWQYHSRVTIWKDPVIEMQRTKNHGLLHKNFVSTADAVRQGMPDYLLVFRKWPLGGGVPVTQKRVIGDYIGTEPPQVAKLEHGRRSVDSNYSIAVWQKYASPVWFDIDQTNVLNYQQAREGEDEKHICPLQLDVIARSVDLWSNKGETVFSPFSGIGSEGYESVRLGRKYIGIELKESYWKTSQKFLRESELTANAPTLFDLLPADKEAV